MKQTCTMHKNALPVFKTWLEVEGFAIREGKGTFQALQVYVDGCGWSPIFSSSKSEYLTTQEALVPVVKRFVEYMTTTVTAKQTIPATNKIPLRPIATAPLDGSHLLLWREDIFFVGYYATGNASWHINAPGLPALWPLPTHWLNLEAIIAKPSEAQH